MIRAWIRGHRLQLAAVLIASSTVYGILAVHVPELASAIGVFYIAVVVTIFVAGEASRR